MIVRDLLGLLVVAALAALVLRIASGPADWLVLYLSALAILGPAAWFTWRDPRAPSSVGGWLWLGAGALLLGALSFLVDVAIGHTKNPSATAWEAAQLAGSMFGFAFTVSIFPGLFLISAGGAVRAAYGGFEGNA